MQNINNVGITQGQYGDHYPLVDPSDDIKYLLGDLSFAYHDILKQWVHPFRIKELSGFGTADVTDNKVHDYDIVIVDANDVIVFDSRVWHYVESNDDIAILEDTDTAYQKQVYVDAQIANESFEDESLKASFYTSEYTDKFRLCVWLTPFMSLQIIYVTENSYNYSSQIYPERANLDVHAVTRYPAYLLKLRVRTEDEDVDLLQNVTLASGYNISQTVEGKTITLAAIAGAGAGKKPLAEDLDEQLETIPRFVSVNSTVPSKHGYLYLNSSECHFIGRKIGDTNSVYFANSCEACCKCEDFNRVGRYLNETTHRYYCLGAQSEAVRDEHFNNVTKWNELRNCLAKHPVLIAGQDAMCPFFDIMIQGFNVTDRTIKEMLILGSLQTSKNMKYVPKLSSLPIKTAKEDICCTHNEAAGFEFDGISFMLRFPMIKPGSKGVFTGKIKTFEKGYDITGQEVELNVCETFAVEACISHIQITYMDDLVEKIDCNVCSTFAVECPINETTTFDPTECIDWKDKLYEKCNFN